MVSMGFFNKNDKSNFTLVQNALLVSVTTVHPPPPHPQTKNISFPRSTPTLSLQRTNEHQTIQPLPEYQSRDLNSALVFDLGFFGICADADADVYDEIDLTTSTPGRQVQ
jgi:hypothetical protein